MLLLFLIILHALIVSINDSYLVLQLNEAQWSELNLPLALAPMRPTSSFLWTRALLIAVQHIVDEHGRYVVEKLCVRHFFVADDGETIGSELFLSSLTHLFWNRFSVLPALSLNDGILHCDIVEGAFDTQLFYTFISRLLDQMQPFPAPNSVIVMDNCRIHKHPDILALIESR